MGVGWCMLVEDATRRLPMLGQGTEPLGSFEDLSTVSSLSMEESAQCVSSGK